MSESVIGVLLSDEAWSDPVLSKVLEPYRRNGNIGPYIYCKSVDTSGPFFSMVAAALDDPGFTAEISLPHHLIRAFVAAESGRQIGFLMTDGDA